MPRFPLTRAADASGKVAEIYRDFQHKMGLPDVPNFICIQGESPSLLAGTCGLLENVLLQGELPRSTKELIFLAIAADRECAYCKEAHTACCRVLGVEDRTIQAVIRGLKTDLPEDIRDITSFAVKCAASPETLNDQDFASLRKLGLSTPGILEVIATASMAVYATIIADATMLEPDAMFAEM